MTGAVLAALAGSLIMGGIVAVVAGVVGREVDEFTPRRRRRSSIAITRALRLRLVLALAVGLVVAAVDMLGALFAATLCTPSTS